MRAGALGAIARHARGRTRTCGGLNGHASQPTRPLSNPELLTSVLEGPPFEGREIPSEQLDRSLRESRERIVIVDCCRDGGWLREPLELRPQDPSRHGQAFTRRRGDLYGDPGVVVEREWIFRFDRRIERVHETVRVQ